MAPALLVQFLPLKLLGYFPLYIGVELILGFAIINKAGGLFGILSLFTGHPINFWQWLYNMLALAVLPVYVTALGHLQTKPLNVRKASLACLVYVIDTFIGLLFTLYFVHFWFSEEDSSSESQPDTTSTSSSNADASRSNQSASPARELFFTAAGTILFLAIRVYFMFTVISFTRTLIKQTEGQRLVAEDEEEEINRDGTVAKIKGRVVEIEVRAAEFLTEYFRS